MLQHQDCCSVWTGACPLIRYLLFIKMFLLNEHPKLLRNLSKDCILWYNCWLWVQGSSNMTCKVKLSKSWILCPNHMYVKGNQFWNLSCQNAMADSGVCPQLLGHCHLLSAKFGYSLLGHRIPCPAQTINLSCRTCCNLLTDSSITTLTSPQCKTWAEA